MVFVLHVCTHPLQSETVNSIQAYISGFHQVNVMSHFKSTIETSFSFCTLFAKRRQFKTLKFYALQNK